MSEQPHPLSLGEVLDRTAQIYRERFLVFFGISMVPTGFILAAVCFGVVTFASFGLLGAKTNTSSAVPLIASLAVGLLSLFTLPVFVGSTALGYAALSHAAMRMFLGESITIREAFKAVWKRGWNYVGLYLLLAVFVAVIPFTVFFAAVIASAVFNTVLAKAGTTAPAQAALGLFVFLLIAVVAVVAFWVLLVLCLSFPASVFEGISAWSSLKRSFALSRGTRGRMILLFLLGGALSQLLTIVLVVPIVVIVAFIPALQGPAHAGAVGTIMMLALYGVGFAAQAFTRPVYGIALTLFYFDQRMRKEGFDIEWLMSRAGFESAAALPVPLVSGAHAIPASALPMLRVEGIPDEGTESPPATQSISLSHDSSHPGAPA